MLINESLPMSDLFLKKLLQHTANDNVLKCISRCILNGWPELFAKVDKLAKLYRTFREELSFVSNVMLKREKIVIPILLKQEVFQKIHGCHLGIVICTHRAKDVMFLLGMNSYIYDCISLRSICQRMRNANPKEPIITDKVPFPSFSREYVASDLFQWDGNVYLLVVNYYRFPEMMLLKSFNSNAVITHLKTIFSLFGIPRVFRSETRPQYCCHEFKRFNDEWNFNHNTISPTFLQSNGLAEKTV